MMAISGQIIKVWRVQMYTKELFSSSFTSLITSMIIIIRTHLMGINIIQINCIFVPNNVWCISINFILHHDAPFQMIRDNCGSISTYVIITYYHYNGRYTSSINNYYPDLHKLFHCILMYNLDIFMQRDGIKRTTECHDSMLTT